MERWFGQDMEVTNISKTKLHFRWGRNKNKGGEDSNSLAECSLKGKSKTTIDGVRGSVGESLWEALSIFQVEGNIITSGDLLLGENHIFVGGVFLVLSCTRTSNK